MRHTRTTGQMTKKMNRPALCHPEPTSRAISARASPGMTSWRRSLCNRYGSRRVTDLPRASLKRPDGRSFDVSRGGEHAVSRRRLLLLRPHPAERGEDGKAEHYNGKCRDHASSLIHEISLLFICRIPHTRSSNHEQHAGIGNAHRTAFPPPIIAHIHHCCQ